MNGILLCNKLTNADTLHHSCGISLDSLTGPYCSKPDALLAHTPYLLGTSSANSNAIISQLTPKPIARDLTHLSLTYGGDTTIALAQLTNKLYDYNLAMMGASTSVYANRIGGFVESVQNYQNNLLAYRAALSKSSAERLLAKQKAQAAFNKMQIQFNLELNAVKGQVKSNKGTPLTSFQRGSNIADSSRNIAKLNLSNQVQTHNLVKFTQHTKLLGNGLAVIDFGSRVGNIHSSYQAGGNWEREMFIESSSFIASAAIGSGVVKAGLGLLIVATPIGWVGIVVGGVAIAGVTAVASMTVNNSIKANSGSWYDSLMNWMER